MAAATTSEKTTEKTEKGRHGGKREGSGRKRIYSDKKEASRAWQRSHRRIYLETNIFQSWLQAKYLAGFETCSDSAFAMHLLAQEFLRWSSGDVSTVSSVDAPVPSHEQCSSSINSILSSGRRRKGQPRKHVKDGAEKENEGPQSSNKPSDQLPSDQLPVVESPITDAADRDSSTHSDTDTEIIVD